MLSETTNESVIERSYIDNAAIKEFTTDTLVPKYFSNIDPSLRSVGLIGMTTELISNVAEDGFNATSVLFREIFPNRAEIPESIYSHAAIFQLSDVFANSATCNFMIAFRESEIIKHMIKNPDSGIYNFTINKDLTVYVEDIPFTLDYDVKFKCVKKTVDDKINNKKTSEYIFSAEYDMSDYHNSISAINNPYIPILRDSNGILAINVTMHQVVRCVEYANIINNNRINLPSVDITFEGQLVGFDVMYKGENDDDYNTQLETHVIYSSPTTNPFCYYQLYDDDVLRLSFNSKDAYFIPDYNSELKIILYITEGEKGNFELYNGDNISTVSETMSQEYDMNFVVASKPMKESYGGRDRRTLESLRNLAVEGYRTALALTTEPDLENYFSDWSDRYGSSGIKFIKRRNDVYERIFGGFVLMKDEDYIYRTNTLNIRMNVSDMANPEKNVYMIDAGTLFVYDVNDESNAFVVFKRDDDKYNKYYEEYLQAVENNEIPFLVDVDPAEIPDHLNRSASFAEFKRRKNEEYLKAVKKSIKTGEPLTLTEDYIDRMSVFDIEGYSEEQILSMDDPVYNKFLFMNPFLIRFRQDPNLVSLYLTMIDKRHALDSTMYLESSFVNFVATHVNIVRGFEREKKYDITTTVAPTVVVGKDHPLLAGEEDETTNNFEYTTLNDPSRVNENSLRVLFVIYDDVRPVCYKEMYPTNIADPSENITFKCEIYTDNDLITSDGLLRLNSDKLVNMTGNDYVMIPMENVKCKIVTLYNMVYDVEEEMLVEHINTPEESPSEFADYDSTLINYFITNEYYTITDPVTFIKPLNDVRSNLYFEDYLSVDPDGNFIYDIMDVRMESVPFVRWNLAFDESALTYFIRTFMEQYTNIDNVVKTYIRNETAIDMKLYNTYGRSSNYYIVGDDEKALDSPNLRVKFDIWFVSGTNLFERVPLVKKFIKEKIESVNPNGLNQLHISNLMREIEMNFSEVDHIRFRGINDFDTNYQSIKLIYTDLDDMTREERRKYVPELLVCELDDIIVNEYIF